MSKIREILNKFNINGHDKIGGTDKDCYLIRLIFPVATVEYPKLLFF